MLDGAASAIVNQSNADGLANFANNSSSGALTIKNGRNYVRTGAFSNAGQVQIGPGASTLSATGLYLQTAGSTTLNGGMLTASGGMDIQGGTMSGTGELNGDIANSGSLRPGNSPGCLSITGNYAQSASGSLEIQKGGATVCTQYDQLAVGGSASLDGSLMVTLINGYQPIPGTTFDILTASARSGMFASTNLPINFMNDCKGSPVYAATFVRLVALAGATFAQQPQSQTICAGQPVNFSVAVNGDPTLTYQWRKNNVNIDGATSDHFTIAVVTPDDAGGYDCVATNECGARFSAVATLTVHVAPIITQPPQPATRCEDQSVSFTVAATGTPPPTYQWQRNGQDINAANADTYSIASVASADAGDITVVVTNDCGAPVSSPVTLTVNTAPTFSQQPTASVACVGGMASFTVAAGSNPAPSFRWRKGGVDLNNGGNVSGATTTTLTINPVGLGDAGAYDCVASNVCNSPDSDDAMLTVFASGSGDVNGDGFVNGKDVQPFVNFLLAGGAPAAGYCAGDMNSDGVVDLPDAPLLVTRLLAP